MPVKEWTLRDPAQRDLENRFVAVTQDRLRRVFDTLSARQQDVVRTLPLLLHLNHPLLPGYLSPDTPCGIADYTPNRATVAAARRVVAAFTHESRLQREFAIRGLYLMGSVGTIAYTKDSDLDIWLCYDPSLSPEEIAKLSRKTALLEAFSQNHGLEVHFFVFDSERFKSGETLGLSAESSGSSQHSLLLDEFYRSGLLLAGLKPLWWYLPATAEGEYQAYVDLAFRQRRISPRHYVDFGGLPAIPAAEFFGAAIWQLAKSIESPYKSVMKLLLMESYAAEYPQIQLLSHRYKTLLTQPNVTLDDLDPYLAMYRKIEEYLTAREDGERLALLRRAFYIKTNEQLSVPAEPRQATWRREILENLVAAWGWTRDELVHLDQRQQWRVDTALIERRALVRALQKSYAVLSDFARRYGRDHKITEADLNILGRKLYAAFEKKPHKLDLITRGICHNPAEADLSVHVVSSESGPVWTVYNAKVEPLGEPKRRPLKRGESLVEVLTWCHFNRVVNAATEWHHYTEGARHGLTELRRVLDALNEVFPTRLLNANEIVDLANSPTVTRAVLFINIGCEVAPGKLAQGDVLTSNDTDAFRFGGRGSSLVAAVDLVFGTGWGEIYCHHYAGPGALTQALCEYLERAPATARELLSVYCFTADYGHAIRQRISEYVATTYEYLGGQPRGTSRHHIVAVADTYHEIYRETAATQFRIHTNPLSLFRALGAPGSNFRTVAFDDNCAQVLPLAAVYRYNKRDKIQVFALQHPHKLDIYIIDEFGRLFVERHQDQLLTTVLDHYERFFTGRLHDAELNGRPDAVSRVVEYYQLVQTAQHGWRATAVSLQSNRAVPYVALRVFVDAAHGHLDFTCYCDDHEFSSRSHGPALFAAIASYVLHNRRSRERYPIYITQLQFAERYKAELGAGAHSTVRLLEFKKRIEYQLTNALRRHIDAAAAT